MMAINVEQGNLSNGLPMAKPYQVEIVMADGSRRYFHSKKTRRKERHQDVLAFIEGLEVNIQKKIMWRYAGENVYRMSTYSPPQRSFFQKAKDVVMDYFDL